MGATATTSLGYAWAGPAWHESQFGKSAHRVMALCEVINYKGGKNPCAGKIHHPMCSHNKRSPHVRCEIDDFCITRYVFVLNEFGSVGDLLASGLKIPEILRFSINPGNQKPKLPTGSNLMCPKCKKDSLHKTKPKVTPEKKEPKDFTCKFCKVLQKSPEVSFCCLCGYVMCGACALKIRNEK